MSNLFASPDEPQPQTSSPEAAQDQDETAAVPTQIGALSDSARGLEAGSFAGSTAARPIEMGESATDALFGTPVASEPGSIDYIVPVAPAGYARTRRSRKSLVAGMASVALLVGAAGGVGGAAAWQQWGPNDPTPGQTASLPMSSAVTVAQPAVGSVAAVAKAALPSVVQIETATDTGGSTGSGVIIRSDGYILTNNHVIEGSGGTVQVLFSDGHIEEAKVVGTAPAYDLAVIQVDRDDLTPLVLGDSSAMLVGDPVIAVGSPLGLDSTVTTGIVSAFDRPVTTGEAGSTTAYIAAIQTDAAINPGNSGGPLLNMTGEVIGINSAIAALPGATSATGAGSVGLGFAIPSNQARRVAEQLIATGSATVPAIGAQLDSSYSGRGVRVADSSQLPNNSPGVVAGSPADEAGVREGDIIVAINGTPVADASSAIVRIRSYAPGDEVTFTLERGGEDTDITVTLGTLDALDFADSGTTDGGPE